MMAEQKVAIAKSVLGTKDTLLSLIPREDGLLVQTMFFEDEVKDLPKTYNKPKVNEAELAVAKTLIASMDQPFQSENYKDEYQVRLKELISDKIAGKEIVAPKAEGLGNVIDLMEALQASIAKQKASAPAKETKARREKVAIS